MHEVVASTPANRRKLISDFVSSADVQSTAQYSERVMKKILAKQINDKRGLQHVHKNSRDMLMNIAHSGTDADVVGRSVNTDNSMSQFKRKDGSPIQNKNLH